MINKYTRIFYAKHCLNATIFDKQASKMKIENFENLIFTLVVIDVRGVFWYKHPIICKGHMLMFLSIIFNATEVLGRALKLLQEAVPSPPLFPMPMLSQWPLSSRTTRNFFHESF